MRSATKPVQRPADAKLLVVTDDGGLRHARRACLAEWLEPGDVLVANDAATLPPSLEGIHVPTGAVIEVRLAGLRSLAIREIREFTAVIFGAGDHRTRTEDRPLPPRLRPGDELRLGPLAAAVVATLGHPRLVTLRFAGAPDEVWAGIARHGRPIQYAHVRERLAMWDVWTRIAALPVAFEPPSAGFALDWRMISALARRGVDFATLTLAAGISSTGDPRLDATLPLDEPFDIPEATVRKVAAASARGGRVIAVGTTVARALEHAARDDGLRAGPGVATGRIGPGTSLRVVDAILTGVHTPGESHYELLRAFAPDEVLGEMTGAAEAHGYLSHEFGDSVLLFRQPRVPGRPASAPAPRSRGTAAAHPIQSDASTPGRPPTRLS